MLPRLLDRSVRRGDQLLQLAGLAVMATAFLLALPSLLVPLGLPIEGDAVDYRVPLIRWALRHHSYPNFSWAMVDDYPALGELLMLPLFALFPSLARLVPLAAYFGLGVAGGFIAVTLDRGRSGLSRAALFWAGAAWTIAFRPVALQSNVLLVDNLASCFFLFSALYAVRGLAVAAGLAAAAALATRYNVWGSAAALPLLVCYFAPAGKKAVAALHFCSIACLGALPFMVRNFFLNGGHPFFPVDAPQLMVSSGLFDYGRGRDLLSLLLFPFDLLYTNTFVRGFFDYTVGKLFYLQAFAVAASALRGRAKERLRCGWHAPSLALWSIALVHFLIWFQSSQQLRFLVPSLMVLNLGMFVLLARRVGALALAGLTLLGALSVLSVQRDSIAIAFGRMVSPFEASRARAVDCIGRAGVGGEALASPHRDGFLGFIENDFYFLPGHPYHVPGAEAPAPKWVYAQEPMEGYEPWPREKPCLQKRREM